VGELEERRGKIYLQFTKRVGKKKYVTLDVRRNGFEEEDKALMSVTRFREGGGEAVRRSLFSPKAKRAQQRTKEKKGK